MVGVRLVENVSRVVLCFWRDTNGVSSVDDARKGI